MYRKWAIKVPALVKRHELRDLILSEDSAEKLWKKFLHEVRRFVDDEGHEPACSGVPEIFFPEGASNATHPTKLAPALSICRNCPLMDICATYATLADERHGIWGATMPEDRRLARKRILRNERSTAAFIENGYLAYRTAWVQANKGKSE